MPLLHLVAKAQRHAGVVRQKVVEEDVVVLPTVAAHGVAAALRLPHTQTAQKLRIPLTDGILLRHNNPRTPLGAGTRFLKTVIISLLLATGPMSQAKMLWPLSKPKNPSQPRALLHLPQSLAVGLACSPNLHPHPKKLLLLFCLLLLLLIKYNNRPSSLSLPKMTFLLRSSR